MSGYYKRWEKEGATWKAILDRIQSVSDAAFQKWGAQIARERWDSPGLTFRWYTDDDIGRSIQVVIADSYNGDNYELRISISAWKDFESPPVRKWKTEENIQTIPVPSNLQELDLEKFKFILENAYKTVDKWTEGTLENSNPLPPRPPNLTGKFVKGRYVP